MEDIPFFVMCKYYFYILYSEKLNRYYFGHTKDITERLKKHNSNHKGFTGKTNDWKLVYYEIYKTKEEAYFRERQVKKWKNRKRIIQLITFIQFPLQIPLYQTKIKKSYK